MYDRGLILLVDQDTDSALTLQELLLRSGYGVHHAANGANAMAALASIEPDLVLLDIQLEDASPVAILGELRRHRQARDVPVILMTTLDDDSQVVGLESGDDILVKPFDEREALARIERQVTVAKVRTALRESEAEFRSVMESAVDAIISGDAEGTIRSWNSAATALFGWRESEVLGRPIERIIPERYRDAHREGLHRVSSGGPSRVIGQTVELAGLRKDGSEFPIELSLATWLLEGKRYYTGILRDISERQQAEQKFRSVTESAIDAIISADHAGRIISWNKAATGILGFTEEEAIGQPLEMIIPDQFHEAHRAGLHRVATGGESHVIGQTVELSACTKSGDEVPIELSLSTWMVREDRYFTGIIRDIGARKRAEEALRQSEQALREKSLELEEKNKALRSTLERLNDAQNQLIIQEKMASLGKLSAGLAHELNNPASAVRSGSSQLHSAFSRLHDTELRLAALDLGPSHLDKLVELDRFARERATKPANLNAIGRSDREAVLQDWLEDLGIEAAWELAPDLVELGCETSDLEELVEVFEPDRLAIVLEWLSRTQSVYNLVSEIGLGAGRISEIIRALKSYTYLDRAPIQDVDVRDGLDNTLIVLHNKLKAGITVRRMYEADIPTIHAYGSELNQVWTNLIDNAADAMEGQGELILRAYVEAPWLVVEIEDDGPGIPEEIRESLFDPFVTTKPSGKGTGLGLNISRNIIVTKHEGRIDFDTSSDGTRFTVRLPLSLASGNDADPSAMDVDSSEGKTD